MRSPKNPSSFIWSWRLVDFSSFPLARIGEVSFEKFRRSCNVCPYSFLLATVGPCRNRAFRRSGANRESDEGMKEKGGKCWKGNRAREVKRERIGRRTSKERWILEGLSIYYSKIDSLLEVWARNDFRATGAASTCLLYLFRPVFSSLSALSLSLQSHRQRSISVAFSRPPLPSQGSRVLRAKRHCGHWVVFHKVRSQVQARLESSSRSDPETRTLIQVFHSDQGDRFSLSLLAR